MRAVLDPNVLVSAAISPTGQPRQILTAWIEQRFELIASPALLDELADVLARPKFRRYITVAVATEFIDGLATDATIVADPPELPGVSPDPDDDYLVALARAAGADYLVSGDRHLLDLTDPNPPVLTPRQFLDLLDTKS
ncbi:MAG TPA: putative toxin-antitoxin system toxin component, PIN family [Solirubrobacteraceae bacterium]|nr:putative toxin-antitoxin system toxin component, PIN family [Solirubrobacteraceae bacterium]